MLMLLIIGFLLLLGVALMVLNSAIDHAVDGYEDNDGFHQKTPPWASHRTSTDSDVSAWDRAEGASCPLDMRPSFRPVGHHPFSTEGNKRHEPF